MKIGKGAVTEMRIETKRLILRPLTMDDLDALHEILGDPVSMAHYPSAFSLEKTRRWIQWNIENYETYGFGLWAVTLKDKGLFIGDTGITMQQIGCEKLPEIGYHIHRAFTGQGYATEAAIVFRDYAFDALGFPAVYSYMKYTNVASARVAEKNGMRLVSELPDAKNGVTKVYRITMEEYLALKSGQSSSVSTS
jgi:RimJ/RimL family protein N-acetyltransferase